MTKMCLGLIALLVTATAAAAWQTHSANQLRVALGEEKQRCKTRFEQFRADAEEERTRIRIQIEYEAAEERAKLREQLKHQQQELARLRNLKFQLIDEQERTLIRQEQQEPEIVPWLDTPVPSRLLR